MRNNMLGLTLALSGALMLTGCDKGSTPTTSLGHSNVLNAVGKGAEIVSTKVLGKQSLQPQEIQAQSGLQLALKPTKNTAKTNTIKPLVFKRDTRIDGTRYLVFSGTTTLSGELIYNSEFCDLCFHADSKSLKYVPFPKKYQEDSGQVIIGISHEDAKKMGVNTSLLGEEQMLKGQCYKQSATLKITDFKAFMDETEGFDEATIVKVISKGKLNKRSCLD